MLRHGLTHAKIWHEVDAKDKVLGKLAQRISIALRGKYKPNYNPAVDFGDYVVVKNARYVAMTGNKETQKEYKWHSGYPGGLKTVKYDKFVDKHPTGPIRKAVWGMLPKNNLRKVLMNRLLIFPEEQHPHKANIFKCHDPADPAYEQNK
ncbi:54S ribosomal protein L23, mitochondrial [Terramyces sp. JEL0728]|nr:54S ribosomal protein L23, mitochondrial [Terramyces sp. JEL0728]